MGDLTGWSLPLPPRSFHRYSGLRGYAVKEGTMLFRTEPQPRSGGSGGRSQHTHNQAGMDRGVRVWFCSRSPGEVSHASSSKSPGHRAVCKASEKQPQNKTAREATEEAPAALRTGNGSVSQGQS